MLSGHRRCLFTRRAREAVLARMSGWLPGCGQRTVLARAAPASRRTGKEEVRAWTVANEACDAGRVMVNGRPAKASVQVKQGDVIEIGFGTKTVKVEVVDVQETTKKEQAKDLFKYL